MCELFFYIQNAYKTRKLHFPKKSFLIRLFINFKIFLKIPQNGRVFIYICFRYFPNFDQILS